MPKLSKAELLRRYFAAFLARERAVVEAAFTEDFTFTSPYDDAISKAAFFERCWPNGDKFQDVEVEKVFEQGDEAFARYRIVTRDGREFRNTEFYTFRGDQIASVQVYFGAAYRDGRHVQET
jgi:ketosteroid isomerase-like protein